MCEQENGVPLQSADLDDATQIAMQVHMHLCLCIYIYMLCMYVCVYVCVYWAMTWCRFRALILMVPRRS